jgi:ribonuclease T1
MNPQTRHLSWTAPLLTSVALFCATVGFTPDAQARRHARPETPAATDTVALSSLPQAAQEVHQRILAGGPFLYSKDGDVFGNYERQLPRPPRGFYHEYTVPTPGSHDRGARRIVCGGKDKRQPETCFYTQDHYQHFQQIDPAH